MHKKLLFLSTIVSFCEIFSSQAEEPQPRTFAQKIERVRYHCNLSNDDCQNCWMPLCLSGCLTAGLVFVLSMPEYNAWCDKQFKRPKIDQKIR